MPHLATWALGQSDQVIQNIVSRGLLLSRDEVRHTLSKMGTTMSLRKLHRKIAIMKYLLEMEAGQLASTHEIKVGAQKYCRRQSSITTDMVGGIMRLMVKWGYVVLYDTSKYGGYKFPIHVYRRTALE